MDLRELVKKYRLQLRCKNKEIKIYHGRGSREFNGYNPSRKNFYRYYEPVNFEAEMYFLEDAGKWAIMNVIAEELVNKYKLRCINGEIVSWSDGPDITRNDAKIINAIPQIILKYI